MTTREGGVLKARLQLTDSAFSHLKRAGRNQDLRQDWCGHSSRKRRHNATRFSADRGETTASFRNNEPTTSIDKHNDPQRRQHEQQRKQRKRHGTLKTAVERD